MKVKSIRSAWLEVGGRRLDCGPYMSGALEARDALERLKAPKAPLRTLTAGYAGGIYNGPQFARRWVEEPRYGVPFLSSGDMMNADLSTLPLLSNTYAHSHTLAHLEVRSGMTLISCSGTIGRMIYVRPDMEGVWSSQHIMKVVPDPTKILPGYLYAFLSGTYGVPLVASGTYGAIIQHIEPEHIQELPVPRLPSEIESNAAKLVDDSAALRGEATQLLSKALSEFHAISGINLPRSLGSPTPHSIGQVSSKHVQSRLDGFYHSKYHAEAMRALESARWTSVAVRNFAIHILEPNRLKRIVIAEGARGIPFFGTSAIFWLDPVPSYFIPKSGRMAVFEVGSHTLLIPRSGQLSGVIGKAVLPYGDVVGGSVSEDAIRIVCADDVTAGYLFVALSSEVGVRQLKARAFGSSIPHLNTDNIGSVLVPDLPPDDLRRLGAMGHQVSCLRDNAIRKERAALAIVERAIEEHA